LTVANDHLSSFELTTAKGKLFVSARFSEYTRVGGRDFPLGLVMTQPPPDSSREEIHLSDLQVGVALADSIARFVIPTGTRIEDLSR
jgi:hypothetical protein